ncbi:MAG: hypothetical protein ACKVU1_07215 [bacterium]
MKNGYSIVSIAALASLVIATTAQLSVAVPIAAPGTECIKVHVNSTEPVVATFQGMDGSISLDNLYLELDAAGNPAMDGDRDNDLFVFSNQSTPVGETMALGPYSLGVELVFRMHIVPVDGHHFTGPVERNPAGFCQARVECGWQPGEALVSFEDQGRATRLVYNDLSFSLTNVACCPPVNETPLFTVDAACGTAWSVEAGQTLSFSVEAADPNSADAITLDVSGLPSGALMVPPLPSSGNPVSSVFTWTPGAADAGTHIVEFTAVDSCATVACTQTIVVTAPNATAPVTWGRVKSLLQRSEAN